MQSNDSHCFHLTFLVDDPHKIQDPELWSKSWSKHLDAAAEQNIDAAAAFFLKSDRFIKVE